MNDLLVEDAATMAVSRAHVRLALTSYRFPGNTCRQSIPLLLHSECMSVPVAKAGCLDFANN